MIKNIIFDFGGVLLNLDYNMTYTKLSNVMGIEIGPNKTPKHILKIMLGYEKGEINTEGFLWNLQKESSKLTPPTDKLIDAWNAMLLGWNPERFSFLEGLRKNYKLFILSNTNDLHLKWVMKDLKKNYKITDFDTRFFDKTFYSHLMRMRKPEFKIYEEVLKEARIKGNETLFIDDNKENVMRAKKIGINAVLHDPKDEITDIMDHYLSQFNS